MKPRSAALVGFLFLLIAVFYFVFPVLVQPEHVDFAGITMLIALGAAMSIMAYVLVAAIQKH